MVMTVNKLNYTRENKAMERIRGLFISLERKRVSHDASLRFHSPLPPCQPTTYIRCTKLKGVLLCSGKASMQIIDGFVNNLSEFIFSPSGLEGPSLICQLLFYLGCRCVFQGKSWETSIQTPPSLKKFSVRGSEGRLCMTNCYVNSKEVVTACLTWV